MEGDKTGKLDRLTILSPSAAEDLAAIYAYTARWWGYDQAERYADLIELAAREAADPTTEHVREVEARPGYLAIMVKWKKAKYSHFVIFRRTDFGAEVVRILHSARDIRSHLEMK